jgi:predicted nucleic acid-binding protein
MFLPDTVVLSELRKPPRFSDVRSSNMYLSVLTIAEGSRS